MTLARSKQSHLLSYTVLEIYLKRARGWDIM